MKLELTDKQIESIVYALSFVACDCDLDGREKQADAFREIMHEVMDQRSAEAYFAAHPNERWIVDTTKVI